MGRYKGSMFKKSHTKFGANLVSKIIATPISMAAKTVIDIKPSPESKTEPDTSDSFKWNTSCEIVFFIIMLGALYLAYLLIKYDIFPFLGIIIIALFGEYVYELIKRIKKTNK